MIEHASKLGWGLYNDGDIKHIRNVERGLKCNCKCPDCGTSLIANQGSVKAWHFSHSTKINCKGESALHLAAKQAIRTTAENKLSIQLPPLSGTIIKKDIMDLEHTKKWSMKETEYKPCDVYIEKRFNDLILDTYCVDHNGKYIAIEILVTHKKSSEDCTKFKKNNIDAIEIDISKLSWDSTPEEILEYVTKKAPRNWLYSSSEKSNIKNTTIELNKQIDSINQSYYQDFDISIKELIEEQKFNLIDLPIFKVEVKGNDLKGKCISASESKKLKVTSIDNQVLKYENYLVTNAMISGKTKVKIVISLNNHHYLDSSNPYLSLSYIKNKRNKGKFYGEWVNVDRWEHKLLNLAKSKLDIKIARSNKSIISVNGYAGKFHNLSEKEKVLELCNKLNLPYPTYQGRFNISWNTTDRVWKLLLFYYSIENYKYDLLNAEMISRNNWFGSMLNFKMDEQSCTSRSKQIFVWLKKLCDYGYIQHVVGLNFRIRKGYNKLMDTSHIFV